MIAPIRRWRRRTAPVPPEPPAVDVETLRLIHKEVKERLARLDANSSRVDTKATSLLGFVSAIALFLAVQKADGWLKLVAFCALAAAGWCGFQAVRVRRVAEAPEARPLMEMLGGQPEARVLTLLTQVQVQAYEDNRTIHEHKATQLRWSLGFLTLAVALTTIALVFGGNDAGTGQPKPAPIAPAISGAAVR